MSHFRDYLNALDKAGQLVHVTKDVSPEFEVAAYVRKSSDMNGPAFVFERLTGHPGWRLAAGLYGTMARCPSRSMPEGEGRRSLRTQPSTPDPRSS